MPSRILLAIIGAQINQEEVWILFDLDYKKESLQYVIVGSTEWSYYLFLK